MQLLHFLLQLREIYLVFDAIYFQSGTHDLLHRNAPEFDKALQDILFLRRCQFLKIEPGFPAAKESLRFVASMNCPVAHPPEKKIDQLYYAGCIVSELQIVMRCPDLWHHPSEKNKNEAYQYYFQQDDDQRMTVLHDHFVYEEIGQDDDGDIDYAVGDQQGSQQDLRLFQ